MRLKLTTVIMTVVICNRLRLMMIMMMQHIQDNDGKSGVAIYWVTYHLAPSTSKSGIVPFSILPLLFIVRPSFLFLNLHNIFSFRLRMLLSTAQEVTVFILGYLSLILYLSQQILV